jgi:hypothetical protein
MQIIKIPGLMLHLEVFFLEPSNCVLSYISRKPLIHTHTHTHTHIYIYNCITEYLLNIKLFKSKKFFIRLNITTSNARAFEEFLHPLSVLPNSTATWHMHVIYTSNGVTKMLGCALSIEKYGINGFCILYRDAPKHNFEKKFPN